MTPGKLLKTLHAAQRQIEQDAVLLDRARLGHRPLDRLITDEAMPAVWYDLEKLIKAIGKRLRHKESN